MYICCKGTESCHENTCVCSLTTLLRNSAFKLIALKFYSQMYCIYVILPKLYNYPTHCSFISSFFLCWIKTLLVPELHSTHEKPHQCCFTHANTIVLVPIFDNRFSHVIQPTDTVCNSSVLLSGKTSICSHNILSTQPETMNCKNVLHFLFCLLLDCLG